MLKPHVWRPLFVVIGVVAFILLARAFYVPADFRSHERGYMYSYNRTANIGEWKAFKIKYQGPEYCRDCHEDKASMLATSPHAIISCENCHGAAFNHPEDPEKLTVNRSRDLCLRCHAALVTPGSGRNRIPGIDANEHNPGMACADCHNPHNPDLAEM